MSDEELIASAKQKVASGAYRAGYAAGFAQAKEMAAQVADEKARILVNIEGDSSACKLIAQAIRALTPPGPEPSSSDERK